MTVDIICVNHLDFAGNDGSQIKGCNIWWLEDPQNNDHVKGTLPKKKFIHENLASCFAAGPGRYNVITDLNGKITRVEKI